MSNSVSFIICSLFYSVLLLIVYFTQNKEKKKLGSKIFSIMTVVIFICLILEISNYFTVLNIKSVPVLNLIVSKLYLVGLMTWDMLFVIYIYVISNKKDHDEVTTFKNGKHFKIFSVFYLIIVALMIFLPIKFSTKIGEIYSYGMSVNTAFVITEIMALFCIFEMLKNIKRIGSKKYAPFFMFIVGGIIVMMIQSTYPQMLLLTSLDLFITYLIFFTMSNNEKIEVVQNTKEKEEKK